MNIKLFRHQKIALSYMRSNNYFALFMEQGTGKTIPSLVRILDLLNSGDIQNALVVGPKAVISAWERDIELFDPDEQTKLKSAITLINYDKIWRGDKKSPYYKKWDCIILDEAHCIKNRTSKRSSFLLKIACMAEYRYILSGTPVSNSSLEDIWSLYCFLDPYESRGRIYSNIFKRHMESIDPNKTYTGSYMEFQNRYCILNMYHKPTSYIHINELQNIINEYSYRVKKIDCLDLPDKLPDEIIKIDLMEKQLYKKLATESAILQYEIIAENPLSRLIKLRQLSSGHIKLESGDIIETKNEKLSILQELIESYDETKKLVVFAEFKYSISKISELLNKLKIKHVVLDGNQKNKNIWRDFQSDPSIRIIVCQYQTASAGIDLFASDTIIFYEPTIRSNILEQARDRIHRTGQKNKCSYIHLLTRGTVEMDIYRALSRHSDFNESLFTEYMDSYRKNYQKS